MHQYDFSFILQFYFPRNASYGHPKALDAIIKDGLWDPYNDVHMGICAEETAKEFSISREEQDEYAISSYKNAAKAWESGLFQKEIVPVSVKGRKGEIIIDRDEEYTNVDFSKVSKLRGAFDKQGSFIIYLFEIRYSHCCKFVYSERWSFGLGTCN